MKSAYFTMTALVSRERLVDVQAIQAARGNDSSSSDVCSFRVCGTWNHGVVQVSVLESFIANGQTQEIASKEKVTLSLRRLATNKDLRTFLTAICQYSKPKWAELAADCKVLYTVAQSSLLVTDDSTLMNEIVRAPHFACLFARITEDVN
jgi:hypothetical protein